LVVSLKAFKTRSKVFKEAIPTRIRAENSITKIKASTKEAIIKIRKNSTKSFD